MSAGVNIRLFVVVLAIGCASTASTQDTKRDDIARLIEITGAMDLENARELFEGGLEQSLSEPLPPHIKNKIWQEMRAEFPHDEARKRLAPIYDELFTAAEIEALIAFYESPAGKKLVEVQGKLVTQSFLVAQQLMTEASQRVMSKLFYYFQGEGHVAGGKVNEAIEAFRKAVALYPDDPDFRESLAAALSAAGNLEEAQRERDTAKQLRAGGTSPATGSNETLTPVRVGGDIVPPKKIGDVAPVYPEEARDAGIQGIVIIEAIIDPRGNVTNTRVLRSIPALDQAALDAVTQWKYEPTLLEGEAVPLVMTITVNFSLN